MKKIFLLVALSIAAINSHAQSGFMKRNADDAFLIDRLDVLSGRLSDSLYTTLQGMPRKDVVQFVEKYLSAHEYSLTENEKYDLKLILSKNGEWTISGEGAINAKKPIRGQLYEKKPDMLNIHKDEFDLIINPIIYYQQTAEKGNLKEILFVNTKGIEVRGNIGKRIGFYSTFTDNQERGPLNHQNYVAHYSAVPGGPTYYKDFKIGKPGIAQDYLNATGYVDLNVYKNKITAAYGQDHFQIGDGYRSLFLSDFGSNYTFFKLNTRFWKFNYQNLYMELTPQFKRGGDKLLSKKYATMHHLSINVTKKLNVGVFESITFGRQNFYDFSYMNPVIFLRSMEQKNGSPDNAMLGLNFKASTPFHSVVYGQVILDEFKLAEIKARNGWWGNKYGIQLGCKIADPFRIKNLLVQGEINMVRPFTYTFRDSVANYTHYNQVLAHPYEANFIEANFIVSYKPFKKTYITFKTFYNRHGRDSVNAPKTYGGNIFTSYSNLKSKYGNSLLQGYVSKVMYGNLNLSYELRNSLFLDLGLTYRSESSTSKSNPTFNSTQVYTGLRLNALRRQYDY